GNRGTTVDFIEPLQRVPSKERNAPGTLADLSEEMRSGAVSGLVILGGNPGYTASSDLGFNEAVRRVPWRARLGLHEDETSVECDWHLPEAHFLESWGDARAFNGLVSFQQPLIAPLYGGKCALELISILLGDPGATSYDLLRSYWKGRHRSGVGQP